MDSNIKIVYVPLLEEGTPVVRPTKGILIHGNVYKVLATPDYDPDIEIWEFLPGSLARGEQEECDGEIIVVLRHAVA